MKAPALGFIARRYLFGKGALKKTALRRIRGGVLGIAFSLVPLVVVFQVASGMIEGISTRFQETWSSHLYLSDTRGRTVDGLLEQARALEASGIPVCASAEIQGMALLKGPAGSQGVNIRAVEPDIRTRDQGFARYLEVLDGEFMLDAPSDMVLGEVLARKLGLKVGDRARLLTYSSDGWGGLPKISSFVIRGIVSSGYQDLDRYWAFVNLERGGRILSADATRRIIGVKLQDPANLPNPLIYRGPAVRYADGRSAPDFASFQLELEGVVGPEWLSYTWFEFQEDQYNHFTATKNLLVFIMILIVLVATVNVSSTMILLGVEKQQDIAILRASGASARDISRIFLAMGAVTGMLGAVLGIGTGLVLTLGVNEIIAGVEAVINGFSSFWHGESFRFLNPEFYLSRIPVRIDAGEIGLMLGLTMVLSVLASWLPARRAARLHPADILRKV